MVSSSLNSVNPVSAVTPPSKVAPGKNPYAGATVDTSAVNTNIGPAVVVSLSNAALNANVSSSSPSGDSTIPVSKVAPGA